MVEQDDLLDDLLKPSPVKIGLSISAVIIILQTMGVVSFATFGAIFASPLLLWAIGIWVIVWFLRR